MSSCNTVQTLLPIEASAAGAEGTVTQAAAEATAAAAAAAAAVAAAEATTTTTEEVQKSDEAKQGEEAHSPSKDMFANNFAPSPTPATPNAALAFPSPINEPDALVPVVIDSVVKADDIEQSCERASTKRTLEAALDLPTLSPAPVPRAASEVPPAAISVASPTVAVTKGLASNAAATPSALSPTYQAAAAATRAATAALQASARPMKGGRGRGRAKRHSSAVATGSNRRQRTLTDSARLASQMLVLPPPACASSGTLLNEAAAALVFYGGARPQATRPLAKYRPQNRTSGGGGLGPGAVHSNVTLPYAHMLAAAKAYRESRYGGSPS